VKPYGFQDVPGKTQKKGKSKGGGGEERQKTEGTRKEEKRWKGEYFARRAVWERVEAETMEARKVGLKKHRYEGRRRGKARKVVGFQGLSLQTALPAGGMAVKEGGGGQESQFSILHSLWRNFGKKGRGMKRTKRPFYGEAKRDPGMGPKVRLG